MKYIKIILLSFLIASAIDVLGVFLIQLQDQEARNQSDLVNLPYGIAIGFNLILALSSGPMFLNYYPAIRRNVFLSGLTFFIGAIVTATCFALSLESEWWTAVLFCLPYLGTLTVFFIRLLSENHVMKPFN